LRRSLLDEVKCMNYEYTTWLYHPLQIKGNVDAQSTAIETKINQMAASGWEYFDSITTGQSNFATLIFRRAKN